MRADARMLRSVAAPLCLVAAAVALGHALQIANGFYDDRALLFLTAALAATAAAVAIGIGPGTAPAWGERAVRLALVCGIGVQILALVTARPAMYLAPEVDLAPFRAGVLVMAALAAAGAVKAPGVGRWWFPACLAVHGALGWWTLVASPTPAIDVVVVHRAAVDALLDGRNPYQITFQNIYGPGSPFYNPEAVAGDRVLFGYPYPPLSLLFAVPAQLVADDYRYGQVAALLAGAALIGYARPSLVARLSAVLLLTTPRLFFVLEQGWTEPIAVLLLGAGVWSIGRRPALTPWSLGLLLVSKQYLIVAAPLAWRTLRRLPTPSARPDRPRPFRHVLTAAGAALAVTAPFAVWHLPAFIDHVVLLQTREPFRIDSLSYLSWAARAGYGTGSFVWAGAAAAISLAFALWRLPATRAGFASGTAIVTFATFAFGSKAFCNYYFFVVAALCSAISVASAGREEG